MGRCQYQNKKALFTDSIFWKVLGFPALGPPITQSKLDLNTDTKKYGPEGTKYVVCTAFCTIFFKSDFT